MKTAEYLSFVVNEIHTTIVAMVDDEGLPVTAAIDMMDCDENSLYFLTPCFSHSYLTAQHSF